MGRNPHKSCQLRLLRRQINFYATPSWPEYCNSSTFPLQLTFSLSGLINFFQATLVCLFEINTTLSATTGKRFRSMYRFTVALQQLFCTCVVFLQTVTLAVTQTTSQNTAHGPQQNCSICSNTYAAPF